MRIEERVDLLLLLLLRLPLVRDDPRLVNKKHVSHHGLIECGKEDPEVFTPLWQ